MAFKTRQIRKRPPIKPFKILKNICSGIWRLLSRTTPKQRSYIWGAILVIIGIFVVSKVMLAAYHFVTGFDPKNLLYTIGSDLEKDENGYTNVLLLGDGGHVRDGADLIDTIMVASIDYEKNAVSLLSIPRDYYVDSESVIWKSKINEIYRNHKNQMDEEARYELFKTVAGEIANLDIQYYARVNFNAFVEVVDSLDGITVDVKDSIYDPYYPNETDDGYTLFEVEKGVQEMDGETALKFVRSRKTTSDFDRAARQQQVLEAIREKALSKDILTSPSKLKNIYSAVSKNMNTDLSLGELIALAGFGQQFDRSHLVTKVMHDDPGQDGGFLYTPEQELYDGLFVLIPFGDSLELIHKYADLIFNKREALWGELSRIEILNATKYSGIARNAAYQLNRFGFNIVGVDNYYDKDGEKKYIDKSVIFYYEWEEDKNSVITAKYQSTLDVLNGFMKAESLPGDSLDAGYNANLTIILGEDYDVFLVK
ncbi:LCP family protein [Patescibacteria group bacterium]|nr:LCP family protein [Patescibacteria group bacterium]